MLHYRAFVHYHFKPGMEEEGLRFLEKELIKKAKEYGCHELELCHNERDKTRLVGIATWIDIEDARRFQSHWAAREKELMHFCSVAPHHEFYKIRSSYKERGTKAA